MDSNEIRYGRPSDFQFIESLLILGSDFTKEEGVIDSGEFILKRDLIFGKFGGPRNIGAFNFPKTLSVYVFDKKSYVVWESGPRKGQIYKILSRTPQKFIGVPSVDDIYQKLDSVLGLLQSQDKKEMIRVLAEFSNYIFEIFEKRYGDLTSREAQYFSFGAQENKFLDLYLKIQNYGISSWAFTRDVIRSAKAQLKLLLENKPLTSQYQLLNDELFAVDREVLRGFSILDSPISQLTTFDSIFSDLQPRETALLIEYLLEKTSKIPFFNNYLPISKKFYCLGENKNERIKIAAVHGTFSGKFPDIIQLGGLASKYYLEGKQVHKISGGEYGGVICHAPAHVSFWDMSKDKVPLYLGYGKQIAFEYPISFAVSEQHLHDVSCFPLRAPRLSGGTLANELVVSSFWPLKCVDYIFVPKNVVKEVQLTLADFGHNHIQVIPFEKDVEPYMKDLY
jgi:hypothetical protein